MQESCRWYSVLGQSYVVAKGTSHRWCFREVLGCGNCLETVGIASQAVLYREMFKLYTWRWHRSIHYEVRIQHMLHISCTVKKSRINYVLHNPSQTLGIVITDRYQCPSALIKFFRGGPEIPFGSFNCLMEDGILRLIRVFQLRVLFLGNPVWSSQWVLRSSPRRYKGRKNTLGKRSSWRCWAGGIWIERFCLSSNRRWRDGLLHHGRH